MPDPIEQLNSLKRCTRCALPETHESITFDAEGICNVCRQVEFKQERIDWDVRAVELDRREIGVVISRPSPRPASGTGRS